MKKNIIMVIIMLMCSMSLLLVLYYFNSKDIYYISENINNKNIELSMIKIENGSTTTITETPTNGFYDISYECENNNATLYWSNNTHKLKVKVTNSPVKCSITFNAINNDLNIMAIYVDGSETTTLSNAKLYILDYANTKCYNSQNEEVSNAKVKITSTPGGASSVSALNSSKTARHNITVENLTQKIYCNIFLTDTSSATTTLTDKILTDNQIQTGDRPGLNLAQAYDVDTTGKIFWTKSRTENTCTSANTHTFVETNFNACGSSSGIDIGEPDCYELFEYGVGNVCKTFYFAGQNDNNYVEFGGFLWRIVRINEDESVKLLYQGVYKSNLASINTSIGITWLRTSYNVTGNDNTYVGWYYGAPGQSTYAATHTNTAKSSMANNVRSWITTFLYVYPEQYFRYLNVNSIFCNDRSIDDTNPNSLAGVGTQNTLYGAYKRIQRKEATNTVSPQYRCPRNKDKYTIASATVGNKVMTDWLDLGGLLTLDELVYMGAYYQTNKVNSTNYFFDHAMYSGFTMTPYYYNSTNNAAVAYTAKEGWVAQGVSVINTASGIGSRLVINLKACTLWASGTGTKTDPYQVGISPACLYGLN